MLFELADGAIALFAVAVLVDLWLGEPPACLHLVVWIGGVVQRVERRFHGVHRSRQLVIGLGLALGCPLLFAGLVAVVLALLQPWPVLAFVFGVWMLTATFAWAALIAAARRMRRALAADDMPAARRALQSLCSRDAAHLERAALISATIESVAENASDSVVAPFVYFALFGIPGAVFYRAVNTLDAMIGYRGTPFEYLGKAAARFDDLLNLLPARLTALLLLLGAGLCGGDVRSGWRVLRRDGGSTESPNAGRPMAAMAGVLGVRLEKPGAYALGDACEELTIGKIDEACRVVGGAALAAMGLTVALLWLRTSVW